MQKIARRGPAGIRMEGVPSTGQGDPWDSPRKEGGLSQRADTIARGIVAAVIALGNERACTASKRGM